MREFISLPPKLSPKSGVHVLIYFIPGNPGYIDYYDDFLASLKSNLAWAEGEIAFHIYGRNLAGFTDNSHEPFNDHNPPYDLEAQILCTANHVAALRVECPFDDGNSRTGQPFDFVILIGHSVGTYIALEIFHRHLRDPSTAPHLKLQSGILLFATVTHIAQSPSGKRLDLVRTNSFLDRRAHQIAQLFLNLWPSWALHWFISNVMRFSPKAADVTTEFLKARDAVWQAIHMGKDEMRTIAEDKWDAEIWGVAREAASHRLNAPKFFFFYGKNDHWVGERARAKFIEAREANVRNGWIRIEIDEGSLPHDFCVSEGNSANVAKRVDGWIKEIADNILASHVKAGGRPGATLPKGTSERKLAEPAESTQSSVI